MTAIAGHGAELCPPLSLAFPEWGGVLNLKSSANFVYSWMAACLRRGLPQRQGAGRGTE